MVTDIPDAEKIYGLYRDEDYILLLRGIKQWDVFQTAIHRHPGGYILFGINCVYTLLSVVVFLNLSEGFFYLRIYQCISR